MTDVNGPWTVKDLPDALAEVHDNQGKIVGCIDARYVRVIAEVPRMLAVIQEITYSARRSFNGRDNLVCCAYCQALKTWDHNPKCQLAELLKRLEVACSLTQVS